MHIRLLKINYIGSRLLKQGFITFLLFNLFNIGYSVGIHFLYAEPSDEGYVFSVIVIVVILGFICLSLICMETTPSDGYGEFKNKFKKNQVCLIYIPLTILYRLIIAFYASVRTQYPESTLITLAFSLLFLIYVCVNTPFTNVYQNYRAVFVHFTTFFILLVTNFYRNMKQTTEIEIKAKIFAPALIELILIVLCIIFSLIILVYEIYEFVREWRWKNKKKTVKLDNHITD